MVKLISPLFCCLLLVNSNPLAAQEVSKKYEHLFTEPKKYTTYRSTQELIIDGNISEPDWNNIEWSDKFVDIEGTKRPLPEFTTRFKMLWDDKHLYIAAEMEEPHVWGTLTKHDEIIYRDNDFEIFIDPDGDTHNYYEIEVNTLNTILDLFMPRPYRNGAKPNIRWNVIGLKSAIGIDGTNNDPSDNDKKWFVEMAIPFSSLSLDGTGKPPSEGSVWNINFSRVQWKADITHGSYKKRKDSVTGRPLLEDNWVWSPQGVINMHYPERWGYVLFEGGKPQKTTTAFNPPLPWELKKHLWLLYYKQKEYFRKHKKYASELSSIGVLSSTQFRGKDYKIILRSSGTEFTGTIEVSEDESWQINQDGKQSKRTTNE